MVPHASRCMPLVRAVAGVAFAPGAHVRAGNLRENPPPPCYPGSVGALRSQSDVVPGFLPVPGAGAAPTPVATAAASAAAAAVAAAAASPVAAATAASVDRATAAVPFGVPVMGTVAGAVPTSPSCCCGGCVPCCRGCGCGSARAVVFVSGVQTFP